MNDKSNGMKEEAGTPPTERAPTWFLKIIRYLMPSAFRTGNSFTGKNIGWLAVKRVLRTVNPTLLRTLSVKASQNVKEIKAQ